MVYTVELRPLALADLHEAYSYYNSVKENLGEQFLEELQKLLDKLESNPFIFSFANRSIRQAKLHRFPYDVVYEVHNNSVIVYSIFMAKQNPNKKRTS